MKIVSVVGARPQFIKAAAVSRALRKDNTEILIHTGQHYDSNMSDVFFEELSIPRPDYNLGVGSKSHGAQTGEMLQKIEEVLQAELPDALLVYGDTNSTLAGALAAAKLHIPVCHIEAGLRSYNRKMPEEINRVMTDHISEWLFCPTDTAVRNLGKEGITRNVYNAGDVMCDTVLYYGEMAECEYDGKNPKLNCLFSEAMLPEKYYMATIHRAENTDGEQALSEILGAFDELESPVVFPVHPRSRELVTRLNDTAGYKNVIFIEPVSYKHMLYLVNHALKVITDSGGLQKEAYILKTPCVTVRSETEWEETLAGGFNVLSAPDKKELINKIILDDIDESARKDYYGDGHAAEKIADILKGRS